MIKLKCATKIKTIMIIREYFRHLFGKNITRNDFFAICGIIDNLRFENLRENLGFENL